MDIIHIHIHKDMNSHYHITWILITFTFTRICIHIITLHGYYSHSHSQGYAELVLCRILLFLISTDTGTLNYYRWYTELNVSFSRFDFPPPHSRFETQHEKVKVSERPSSSFHHTTETQLVRASFPDWPAAFPKANLTQNKSFRQLQRPN